MLLLLLVAAVHGAQFLRTSNLTGASVFAEPLGTDFTVVDAITVRAIGLLDADAAGLQGVLTAFIVSRVDGTIAAGPVSANSSHARPNASEPFVFFDLRPPVRLPPSKYTLLASGFLLDRYGGLGLAATNDSSVLITGSVSGDRGYVQSREPQWSGASFLFDVASAPGPASAVISQAFRDCEEVACAGGASGFYNILGRTAFCDSNSDSDGGGWMRLFRLNDTACEARPSNWTSSRNPSIFDTYDIPGCRPMSARCSSGELSLRSPFPFSEVRGSSVAMAAFATIDGASSFGRDIEGVSVRLANGTIVWTFVATFSGCACESRFQDQVRFATKTAGRWTCLSVGAEATTAWAKMNARNSCKAGDTALNQSSLAALSGFRTSLSETQSSLTIDLCRDESATTEDVLLESMDVWVRPTIGFSKATNCASAATLSFPAALATTRTETAAATGMAASVTTTTTTTTAPTTSLDDTELQLWAVGLIVLGVLSFGLFVCVFAALAVLFRRARTNESKAEAERPREMYSARDDTYGRIGSIGSNNSTPSTSNYSAGQLDATYASAAL
jgi:hypothetical protein